MGVIKKKPYEISIWEDRLVTEEDKSYYKEIKLAIIGSDKMESPNRAFNPVLTENVNGEKTLTFSLAYKYYDEFEGELVTNPFYGYLINERKIKLFYNGEWNEFVIKECEESSEENIFNYTAKELFSLELAKLGYNVTLDTELNNNQGTIIELAKKVLEGTDWEVDEENSDILTQYVQEPLYKAVIDFSKDEEENVNEDEDENTGENENIANEETPKTLTALNLDTKELVEIDEGEIIYIFYSYINNKITDNIQFIREKDSPFEIDDDNVITSTNYRIIDPVTYSTNEQGTQSIQINKEKVITIGEAYVSNQGYRLVYKIRTTYDPVMDRTVEIYQMPYEDSVQEIYHFLDYNYTTSDIVMSYITNGSKFELYDDGSLPGWYNTTPVTPTITPTGEQSILQPIRTTTYPELSSTAHLQLIDKLSRLNGYIELKFKGVLTKDESGVFKNTYFNEGFERSASMIDHISAGEKFALRTRYYTASDKHKNLVEAAPIGTDGGLRVMVAKYEPINQKSYLNEDSKGPSTIKSYKILPSEIILDFDGEFTYNPNIIENGTFNDDKTQYLVDNVIQVPSTSYIYRAANDTIDYIWDWDEHKYVLKNWADSWEKITDGSFNDDYTVYTINGTAQTPQTDKIYQAEGQNGNYVWNESSKKYILKYPFSDYYITTAVAKQSLTNEDMSDPKLKLGIFLYTKDNNLVDNYVYLQDIQLTRYYEDANENPVTIGNAPTAVSAEAHKYYLKPTTQIDEKEINTYGTLDALADELGANVNTIKPVYNEESEKILSIQASQSNYFNILQDLCEKFECWLDIRVSHEEDGSITLDENNNPIKKVAFKEYAGKDNFAGFRNGINLQGITRNIDSNEIVTKLIVDPVQSEYSDTGSIEIQRAKSNPSGQSYIINFSYYLNRGLMTQTREEINEDLNKYYASFSEKNQEIIKKQDELVQVSNSLTRVSAQRNDYTALIAEAERKYNEAIADFQDLTNWEYDEFVKEYQNIEDWAKDEKNKDKNYLENDTILETVADIYVASVTIQNYTGLLTNLDKQYQDLDLKLNGAKEYGISVTYVPGMQIEETTIDPLTKVVVDNYVSGLQFELNGTKEGNKYSVIYTTTPNERIFEAKNEDPYQKIVFKNLPEHYQLEYYVNDEAHIVPENELGRPFDIYDYVTEETCNKRFKIVPKADWANDNKGLQQEIDELIEQKNQIEKEFYKKYSRFLQEGTWSSQDYIDNELYYFDALQVSDTSAQPKVSYTIDVLEVSQIDGLENYDFRVGDKTYIEDPDFFGYIYQSTNVGAPIEKNEKAPSRPPIGDETTYIPDDISQSGAPVIMTARSPVREEVIVSEIEWHFDEPDNNTITIQNYKTRFEDLFQRISATVQTVQRNEITYPKTSSILDKSGLINSTLLADSLNGIGGIGFALTTNGSVQATEDGLLIRNLLDPANVMRLASSGLQVSTDGGENWATAISAEGISTDVLTAGTINTQNIWLMDGDNPSFRWDKAGLNAYGFDEQGNNSYDLKTYVRFDKYGLYGIKNDEEYVAKDLKDVKEKAHFGITWEGFFIKNSYEGGGRVEITSDNDFRVLKDENTEKIKIGALEWNDSDGNITTNPEEGVGIPTLYGIRILNDAGAEVMKTGDDGNLTISGTINALAGDFLGHVNVGKPDQTHIIIDGESYNPTISSSNYSDGAGTGWIINSEGDATFSNVSVRGAIKTAVFEYEEIQAVGGAFLFRPSSTIKTARYDATPTQEISEDNEIYTVNYYHYQYTLTSDEEIDNSKIYYKKVITEEQESYQIVETPVVAEMGTYYERQGNKTYNDLILTVEKPLLFMKGNWVKISNYNGSEIDPEADADSLGLVHIYEVGDISNTATTVEFFEKIEVEVDTPISEIEGEVYKFIDGEYIPVTDGKVEAGIDYYVKSTVTSQPTGEITLVGGCAILDGTDIANVEGGALIDFGEHKTATDEQGQIIDVPGDHNYGIGINSSDNYVNLPARSISLFETVIRPSESTKVEYIYKDIFGTLPALPYEGESPLVSKLYYDNMEGTQGIYTDNMYIGNKDSYLAFYADQNDKDENNIPKKKLRINGADIMFTYEDGTEKSIDEKIEEAAQEGSSLLAGHFLYYSKAIEGASTQPSANIIQYVTKVIDGQSVDVSGNPSEWGYNTNIGSNGIRLRYNENNLVGLTTEGLQIYNGNSIVASYGKDIVLGQFNEGVLQNGIKIADGEVGFYNKGQKTSYVNNTKLFIPYSVVLNEMVVGSKNEYELTSDETIEAGKIYYQKTGDLYEEVKEPSDNPAAAGYYEVVKTTDLWSWKVTETGHLRLVWKGGEWN